MTPTERRIQLLNAGYLPLPVIGKQPPLDNWSEKIKTSVEEIERWGRDFQYARSTGLLTRSMPVFDIDILNAEASEAVEALVRERFEERGCILVRIGRPPKRAIPFRTDEPFKKLSVNFLATDGSTDQKFEFLCDGQQVVGFGKHKDTGKPYQWFGGEPGQVKLEDLPYITADEAKQLVNDAVRLLCDEFNYSVAPAAKKLNGDHSVQPANWGVLIAAIRAGRELHDSTRDFSADLIRAGMNPGAAVNLVRAEMDESAEKGTARWQQRYDDIPRAVRTIQEKLEAETRSAIHATPFAWRDPASIPARQWLYGQHLVRRFCSATFATSGIGKSSLKLVEALALASGRPLLGIEPKQRCRVWSFNGEDPREEIERRIAAACLYHKINPDEFQDYLFVDSGREQELVIARDTRDGAKIAEPVVNALIGEIRARQIDVLSIDPFVSSHRVTENDNNAIDAVAKKWNAIADITNIAIELSHHTRKTYGAEATVDDGRGAGALLAAVRAARTLNVMSEHEAEQTGITARRRYFRVENGKTNLAPPPETADWYEITSVNLNNGDPAVLNDFGVVKAWHWPDLAAALDEDFDKVAAVIQAGEWRENAQAARWVGKAVAQALGLNPGNRQDRAKISAALKGWLAAGRLVVVEGLDEKRMLKSFVVVA
jgi:AAA domain/Bifunctional DNA primase/polymerase, N-terminal